MAPKKNSEILSPGEVIEKYPSLKKINWTAEYLAMFVRTGVLKGTFNSTKRITLIEENSLFQLINFRNSLLESQKLEL